jgi:hypothetical protein
MWAPTTDRRRNAVKKVRAAAVIAVATTVVTQARDYAREHPDQAADTLDGVERFLRDRAAPRYSSYIEKGSTALRHGLGLRASTVTGRSGHSRDTWSDATGGGEDPDPDTAEPWAPHEPSDPSPLAPNPSPGTGDDPQPRRAGDDPAPMTPGEHRAP